MQTPKLMSLPGSVLFRCLLLVCLLLFLLPLPGYASSGSGGDPQAEVLGSISTIFEGWQVRNGDSPVDRQGTPLWLYDNWENEPPNTIADEHYRWYKVTLPAIEYPDPVLVVEDFYQIFAVYGKDKLLFQRGEFNERKQFYSDRWTMIPLPQGMAGQTVYFRVYGQPYELAGIHPLLFVSSKSNVLHTFLKEDGVDAAFAVVFLFIGLASLAFFLIFRQQTVYGFLALLACNAALWLWASTDIGLLLIPAPRFFHFAYFICVHLMIYAVYGFLHALLTFGGRIDRQLRWGRRMYSLVLVFAAVVNFNLTASRYPYLLIFMLTVVGLTHLLSVITYVTFKRGIAEMRIVFASSIVLVALGIFDVCQVMLGLTVDFVEGVFHNQPLFPLGMLIFIGALAFILIRRVFETQQQLKRYSQELIVKTDEMKLIKEAVQAGTSYLRHAIKNDLGAIRLFSEKIREYALEGGAETLIKDTNVILNKSQHLVEMMKRVNVLTSDIHLVRSRGDMVKLLTAVLAAFEPALVKHDIQWQVSPAPFQTRPIMYEFDAVHLEEVLHNLLQNAIEAMPAGGELDIALLDEAAGVTIRITDTGDGIKTEHLPHVCELFFSTKKREANFGLGLHYCERVVHKHGGSLHIDSCEGVGTTVSLAFPNSLRSGMR